jgi:NTP pyrophosphatase (non-canonical NTP hydrolase)
MDEIEHLLVCLAEECGEVAKEVCKALRFGLDDQVTRDPHGPRGTNGPTNREKIVAELNDLLGVVAMLRERKVFPLDWEDGEAAMKKMDRVEAFMGYARRVGALT